ncbi:hypothetical protein ERO13_D13G215900v2 [Gossypium hirsutum]|uniref:Transcription factor MYB36 n=1 Tax=Gossypium hirsutum TaxID=3635 RepID=A0A1U8N304_GOSHI|nr:transcription factor MYB36 [Gossypium hirsutum]KAG4113318.1 hypothetical protein ERO13_D13G215900v2 [Gossypium hirsutum]
MGRAPCCDKANVKKGPWSPEEDAKLKAYIEKHGTRGGNWIALPHKIGLKRCGKSCRLRWLNYLRPNIKHGGFSEEEDNIICNLYLSIGSRWSIIAAQLPGRTDNDIKNYWNTKLKKKLLGRHKQSDINTNLSDHSNNNNNQFPQGLTNSAMERLQLHLQLQALQNPIFSFYNNPALWPNILPLQQKVTIQGASNGSTPNIVMEPAAAATTPLTGDTLVDSKPVAMGPLVSSFRQAEVVDEFVGVQEGGEMAEVDGFDGLKDNMVWWSNGFDAKVGSSNCWDSASSVVQFNEMFKDYELGFNM